MESKKTLFVVAGATGSGKSAFGVKLARALGGEIVNGDSVQLYQEHTVGSAMPSEGQRKSIPHHLFEVLEGDKPFDVQQYCEMASATIHDIQRREKSPIVVGGSSLYLQGLLQGLSQLPKGDLKLRAELEGRSSKELYQELQEKDPVRASELHPNDKTRIVRSLEVCFLSGSTYSELCLRSTSSLITEPALVLVLVWPRSELYRRINKRTQMMVSSGLLEETHKLSEKYGEQWQSASSLGYQQVLSSSEIDKRELTDAIAQATRRYSKRQMTFWRNSPQKLGWSVFPCAELEELGYPVVTLGGDSAKKSRKGEVRAEVKCYALGLEELSTAISDFERRAASTSSSGSREVWFLSAEHLFGRYSSKPEGISKG